MSMQGYLRAKSLIQKHFDPDEDWQVGSQSTERVESVEQKIGQRLPPTFCQFLLDFGTLTFRANDFYGIGATEDGQPFLNVFDYTEDALGALEEHPDNLLLVWEEGIDYVSYLRDVNQRNAEGEAPVLELGQSPDSGLTSAYNSYGEFLLDIVTESLD